MGAALQLRYHGAPGNSRVIPFPRRARRYGGRRAAIAPYVPGEPPEDPIIRRVWALRSKGEMSEAAAGELHDALIGLRDGGRR